MAVPHPDEELARLQKLVAKGLPPLVVVTGTNDFFRTEATDLLLAAVPKSAELRVVDAVDERAAGDGASEDDDDGGSGDDAGAAGDGAASCPELQDLRGGGLFARTAFVCVRRGTNWWKNHVPTLAAQLPRFARGCGLILEAAKLDKRKKVAQTLVKQLADAGSLFEFRDLWETPFDRSRSPAEGELAKWVAARGRKLGVALTPDAAWLLVAQVGKNLAELAAELGRLRDRLGAEPKGRPLGPDDLRGKVTTSFESTPFDLAEAVLGMDRRRALRSVHAMFDRGVRGKDGRAMDTGGLLPFATSWLYQSLATALEGRQLLESGVSPRDLPGRVGVRTFVERWLDQVQRVDTARLRRGLLALHACQRQSRITSEEPDVLLERFLAQWFDGAPIPTAEDLEL